MSMPSISREQLAVILDPDSTYNKNQLVDLAEQRGVKSEMDFLIKEAEFRKLIQKASELGKDIITTHLGDRNHRYQRIVSTVREMDGKRKFQEKFKPDEAAKLNDIFREAREEASAHVIGQRIPRDQIELCKLKVRKLTGSDTDE